MSEKYGFVYLWRDKKHNRYYIGCHWGSVDDGYICSSNWMRDAYKRRPGDFRRRILKTNIKERSQIYVEEERYFGMIKPEELHTRYYNLSLKTNKFPWHQNPNANLSVGQKISASKKGKSSGPCSPEKAKAISEAKLAKQHKMTDEAKKKMSLAKAGVPLSEEHKEKVLAGLDKGRKMRTFGPLTQEHKDAISKKLTGTTHSYTHSELSREAQRLSQQLGAAALKGSKAYNNGITEKRCKEHPGEGWLLGGLPRSAK